MDMLDFFFPEQAQASHLRNISRTMTSSAAASSSASAFARRNESGLDELRSDVQFLTLVIAAILKRLAEQETMSLGDVSDLLGEIDGLDGFSDGGLQPDVLRGILGAIRQEPVRSPGDRAEINLADINIVTTPRYRNR